MNAWRLSLLRLAWRDIRGHRARSLLVMTMVGLPVLLLVAGVTLYATITGDARSQLPYSVGNAQARVTLEGTSSHSAAPESTEVTQTPEGEVLVIGMNQDGASSLARPTLRSAADLQRMTGGRVLPHHLINGQQTEGTRQLRGLLTDPRNPMVGHTVSLISGRLPQHPGEVAVTPDAVRSGSMPPTGQTVITLTSGQGDHERVTVTVVGTADVWDPKAEAVSFVALPDLTRSTPAWITSYLLDRDQPVSYAEVLELNKHGVSVVSRQVLTHPPAKEDLDPSLAGHGDPLILLFLIMGGVALTLETVLLVGPAFAVIVSSQRRSLGLTALNGATRRQIRLLVLAQALLLGVVSVVAAVPLGVATAAVVERVLHQNGTWVNAVGLDPPWLVIGSIATVGIFAALVAASFPARGLSRLELAGALRVGSLTTRAPRRGMPFVGAALVAVGTVVMLMVAFQNETPQGAALSGVCAVVVVFGGLMMVPRLLHHVGMACRNAPLVLRLAARDASRQRSRSTPAVASIMAAVGVIACVLVAVSSDETQGRLEYSPSAPAGMARVSANGANASQMHRVASTLAARTPGARAIMIDTLVTPVPNGDPPTVNVIPQGCTIDDLESDAHLSPQCDSDIPTWTTHVMGVSDIEALLPELKGRLHAESVVMRDAGTSGRADPPRQVQIAGVTSVQTTPVETESHWTTPATVTLVSANHTALRDAGFGSGPLTVITPGAVKALGLTTQPESALILRDGGFSAAEEGKLVGDANSMGATASVEHGYDRASWLLTNILLIIAALIVLVAALTSTALSLSEQKADLATLAAVGARGRTRRAVASAQALFVAGCGTLFGIALGLVPGVALAIPLTRDRLDLTTGITERGTPIITIPPEQLIVLAIAVPVMAAAIAWLSVRGEPSMTRRQA